MKPFEETTHVFTVRIWFEPREDSSLPEEWRGSIEYLATQERRYFHNLSVALNFIREWCGIPEDRSLPKEKKE